MKTDNSVSSNLKISTRRLLYGDHLKINRTVTVWKIPVQVGFYVDAEAEVAEQRKCLL